MGQIEPQAHLYGDEFDDASSGANVAVVADSKI